MEDNWPLLTMSRGPFDAHLITRNLTNVGDKASRAATVFAHTDDVEVTGDAWGGDDLMLDEDGNPDVDEDEMQSAASEKEDKEGGWDVDDDLALPVDVEIKSGGDDDDNFYTAPSRGQPPSTYWPNNSRLVADHVASGAFDSAARLLCDQLGITRIEPFKQLFLTTYA
ncbi:unnamed protein product, partial [Onchocerca flexuosa]|uniref:COPI_C domain-containing protein n=1 Tax=Onchocerca flexuosa TaxID=387005 RepID=A0A183HMG7_9BILA